jgi:hypothetical protein
MKPAKSAIVCVLTGARRSWKTFNSGVLLWKTDAKEMERLYQLTLDDSFMQPFSGDQSFLNSVYPERRNETLNNQIAEGNYEGLEDGQVSPLPWEYNAQTHPRGSSEEGVLASTSARH